MIQFDVNMSHSDVLAAVSRNEDGCMKFEINVADDVVNRVKPLLQLRRPLPPIDVGNSHRKCIFVNVQTLDEVKEYIEEFINHRFECLIEDKIERDKSIYIKDIPYELKDINRSLEYITELLQDVAININKDEDGDDSE